MDSGEQEKKSGPANLTTVRPRSLGYVLGLALALGIGTAAVIAHVHVNSIGDDYKGYWAILDRVFDLLLASAITVLAFGLGRKISRRLSLTFVGAAEEISFSIMMGTGGIGLSVFLLALAGQLKPIPTIVILGFLLLISRSEIAALSSSIISASKRAAPSAKWAGALFGVLLLPLTLRALTPPHGFDEAIYHLAVPELFVEHGKVYPIVSNPNGNMPFLVNMLYCVFLIAKADIAAKVFSLILAITTAISLYAFSVRFLNRKVGLLAMFGFFGAGMVVELSVTTRVDVACAGMVFLSLYAMAVCLETGGKGWFYASAVLSGFSLGIKYSALLGLGFILLLFIYQSLRAGTSLSSVLKRAMLYSTISLVLVGPWLAKNAVWFHNPIYPYITGQVADYGPGKLRYYNHDDQLRMESFLSQARQEIPDVVKAEEDVLSQAASLREVRHPLRFWEYFTNPEKYNVAEEYVDPNYLFTIIPLCLFVACPRWIKVCGLFSAVFFVCMVSASWVARYLMPVYPPLTIVAAFVLSSVADRIKTRTIASALPAIAVSLTVLAAMFVSGVQTYRMRGVEFITGKISRRQFRLESYYFAPINFINDQIPRDEGILMFGAEMAYGLTHPYIANGGWNNNEWSRLLVRNDSLEAVRNDLIDSRIRYILFSPDLFTFSVETGAEGSGQPGGASVFHSLSVSLFPKNKANGQAQGGDPDYTVQLRNWATFSLFAARFGEPVRTWKLGSFTLYRIK
jgi:hypothetical protein